MVEFFKKPENIPTLSLFIVQGNPIRIYVIVLKINNKTLK
jgi:hypothetical protein